jgi:hypothetical protein
MHCFRKKNSQPEQGKRRIRFTVQKRWPLNTHDYRKNANATFR